MVIYGVYDGHIQFGVWVVIDVKGWSWLYRLYAMDLSVADGLVGGIGGI